MRRRKGPKGGRTTTTPGGLVKTGIYLDPEVHKAARKLAASEGISLAELVRRALEDYLQHHRL